MTNLLSASLSNYIYISVHLSIYFYLSIYLSIYLSMSSEGEDVPHTEYLASNVVVYTNGDIHSLLDTHFSKALSQAQFTKGRSKKIRYRSFLRDRLLHRQIDSHTCILDWPISKSRLKTGRNKKIWGKNEFSCA